MRNETNKTIKEDVALPEDVLVLIGERIAYFCYYYQERWSGRSAEEADRIAEGESAVHREDWTKEAEEIVGLLGHLLLESVGKRKELLYGKGKSGA